ncbi:MAG TPA: hypothetical protein VM056_07170 [Terriglobales bacterium]|nr:hypothetical protein [Terriglobales bacterium]
MQKLIAVFMAFALVFSTGCAETMSSTSGSTRQSVPSSPTVAESSQPGEIPSGTELMIRTNDTIDSKAGDATGRTYSAEIAREVVARNGGVLIPKGSPVTLAVVSGTEGGTVGTDSLELAIRSVTVNGRMYNVQTGTVEASGKEGLGGNKRTATMVGGGALLGTLIGAVAGGAKGAVIGAAVGAGAGVTAQVLTRGKEVKVPAESVLTFRLNDSIYLR